MGRTGVINKQFNGEENEAYHDIIALFKIYRSVNWRMQIKVNQMKHRIQWEYGTDIDTFLDSIYQAGMDINQDLGDMKERIEIINRSNKFLKLIDEAVELMRKFHPQGNGYTGCCITAICQLTGQRISRKYWTSWSLISQRSHGSTGQRTFAGGIRHLRQSAGFYGVMKRKVKKLWNILKIIMNLARNTVDLQNAKIL